MIKSIDFNNDNLMDYRFLDLGLSAAQRCGCGACKTCCNDKFWIEIIPYEGLTFRLGIDSGFDANRHYDDKELMEDFIEATQHKIYSV